MQKKNQNKPTVTIGLPVYNGSEWLNDCLLSLINQDYENIEIVIRDDCSTDDTRKICNHFVKKYDFIKFFQNKKNVGGLLNLKTILDEAESDYFVWASQDDLWEPDFISSLVNVLEKNTNFSLASGNIELINGDKIIDLHNYVGWKNPQSQNKFELSLYLLLPISRGRWFKNHLFIHGVVRTKMLKRSLSLLKGIPGDDRVYVLFMIMQGEWGYVDKILFHKRGEVGLKLRENKKNDLVNLKQKHPLTKFADGMRMVLGIIKIKEASFHLKISVFPIILFYIISMYMKYIRSFLVYIILRNILPGKVYQRIRLKVRKFQVPK